MPVITFPLPAAQQPISDVAQLRPDMAAGVLQKQIDQILDAYAFEGALWGIKIFSLDRNEVLYERNSEKLMMPASNMKIVTAAAALLRLGPDFRFTTRLQSDGEIEAGTLKGNLYVIGSGDPTISARMHYGTPTAIFFEWVKQLRSQGIQKIDGSIVGIDNCFDEQLIPTGWPSGSLNFPYAAETSGLQFNDNIIAVKVTPTRNRRLASVRLDPPTHYVKIENHVVTRTGSFDRYYAYRNENTNTIVLRGSIGTRRQKSVRFITVHQPAGYFVTVLKETLEKNGIRVNDSRLATADEEESIVNEPERYRTLIAHESLPMSQILTEMMKSSHNLFAETLAKTLGSVSGQKGNYESAKDVILESLAPLGVNKKELVYKDGSGLSDYDAVTPNLLATILSGIRKTPLFPIFYDSLPIAGLDGTLQNRMTGTSAEGNVHAKTGFVSDVRSLSGYVTSKDGEHLGFVLLVNNLDMLGLSGRDAEDQICIRLSEFTRTNHRDTEAQR